MDVNINRKNNIDLNLKDQILLLLYSQKDHPVYGRTLLFKELFLFYKEMIEGNEYGLIAIDPEFIPYRYGPFSFPLSRALTGLVIAKMVKVSGKAKSNVETFSLTEIGISMAKITYGKLPEKTASEFFETLQEMRIGWDQLGRAGIVKYVKIMFPKFALENSLMTTNINEKKLKELIQIEIVSIQKEYEDDKWALMFAE